MRAMALDVGNKRTGVAISDPTRLLARTLTVIAHDNAAAQIADLIAQHEVRDLVVGYPRHVGGKVGEQAKHVEAFVAALKEELQARSLSVEIIFWDERYTTLEAERILDEIGSRRRHKGRRRLDALAAAVMLQEYLDAQRSSAGRVDQTHPSTGASPDTALPSGKLGVF